MTTSMDESGESLSFTIASKDALTWQKKQVKTLESPLSSGLHKPPKQPTCHECGSQRLYRDGLRHLRHGSIVQRWLCRDCGYRFSDPNQKKNCNGSGFSQHVQKIQSLNLKTPDTLTYNCQVSARRQSEVKNLVEVETRQEKAQRESTATASQLQGKIIEYAWKMKKRGQAESTIKNRTYRLSVLVRKGCDLMNPDSFETVLATEPWTPANKRFFVNAYISFTKAFNIPWIPIRIRCERKEVFIPLEKELDTLISGCGRKTATFLQVLKTTGARLGEAAKLKWIDINTVNNTIAINSPEKGSRARTIKVSAKTIAMLNALPKTSQYVFSPRGSQDPAKTQSLQSPFARSRKRLARTLQNPRLKQIHFHTFRHWFATMLYAKTRDPLYVKQQLGHKRLENTELYMHLIDFAPEEYIVKRPRTSKEEDELIKSGFQYVRFDNKENVPIYRQRK